MAKKGNLIGAWAFLIGVLLAIIIGFAGLLEGSNANIWSIILVVLGIIIGFLNISVEESEKFMIAGTVLVLVGFFGGQYYLGLINFLGEIVKALVIIFVPATIIVALKSLFGLAKR